MKQKQKKAAKAALGCLVLLLLYGCASRASGGLKVDDVMSAPEDQADFSWDGSGNKDVSASGEPGGAQDSSGAFGEAVDGGADAAREPEEIAVYVCGAVEQPGVYRLAAGSRVYEAVAMAGGMTGDASERGVNQAEVLDDGQMIVILTEEEAAERGGESGQGEVGNKDGLVSINTAGAEELKTLPGIGEAKAAAIIDYREKNGAFTDVSDIKKVSGIGDSVYARLEGLIKAD